MTPRFYRNSIFGVIATAFFMLLTIASAFADDGYPIHIQETLQTAITVIFGGLAAVASWLLTLILGRISSKLKIDIDAQVRAYLDDALYNGIRWAENKAISLAENVKDPHVQSQIVSDAVNYVLDKVPDAVNHFGLTAANIDALVKARLVKTTTEAAGEASATG